MRPGTTEWTDAEIEAITRLWNEGLTARQIADTIGTRSRPAILGIARRLKLPFRVKQTAAPKHRQSALARGMATRINRDKVRKALGLPQFAAVENPKLLKSNAWDALPGTTPVTLMDLEPGMCKWPIGQDRPYLFCGAHADGVYCPEHTQRATPVFNSGDRHRNISSYPRRPVANAATKEQVEDRPNEAVA